MKSKRNSDIGNSSFNKKLPAYSESSYQLTNQLGQLDKWDFSEIENRQRKLAELAIKT